MEIITLVLIIIVFSVFLVLDKISFSAKTIKFIPFILFILYMGITGFSDDCCGCNCSCKTIEKKYKLKIDSPYPPAGLNTNDCMNFLANPQIDWHQIYNNHWMVKIEIDPSGTQSTKCYIICNNGVGTFNGSVVDCDLGGVINAYSFNISGMYNEYLEFDAICNSKFTIRVYIKTNCTQCDLASSSKRRYSWMYQKEVEYCEENNTIIELSKPWEQKFEDCWSDCQW